ncbi:Glu-tRNA(Gln) amidotransferase GatDE subunit E, partial [Sulfolobus sp. A20-N-G8]
PPRRVDEELLEEAKKLVPEPPEVKLKKYVKLGLSEELAKEILRDPKLDLFEELVSKYSERVQPSIIATLITNTLKYVKSKGGDISKISEEDIEEIVKGIYENRISKDSIQEILLEYTSSKSSVSLSEVMKKYEIIPVEELEKIVEDAIKSNIDEINKRKEKAINIVMSKVMSRVKGRADGKLVLELIKAKLKDLIG